MITIKTKNLVKRFGGVCAIDQLSIEMKAGQVTGIIGPNGSGKTTLINLLSGVLSPDSGEITVNETDNITRFPPHRLFSCGITRTFQHVRLFEQITVLDNILIALTTRNALGSLLEKYSQHNHRIAKSILLKTGLLNKSNQLAVNLSYGQRKLLEIARALATNAELYFFDEPFAGLFSETQKRVVSIIEELKQNNKTIVLIEHDMSLIRELCDYIFVLDEGKLLAEGRPEFIFTKEEVVKAYLGQ